MSIFSKAITKILLHAPHRYKGEMKERLLEELAKSADDVTDAKAEIQADLESQKTIKRTAWWHEHWVEVKDLLTVSANEEEIRENWVKLQQSWALEAKEAEEDIENAYADFGAKREKMRQDWKIAKEQRTTFLKDVKKCAAERRARANTTFNDGYTKHQKSWDEKERINDQKYAECASKIDVKIQIEREEFEEKCRIKREQALAAFDIKREKERTINGEKLCVLEDAWNKEIEDIDKEEKNAYAAPLQTKQSVEDDIHNMVREYRNYRTRRRLKASDMKEDSRGVYKNWRNGLRTVTKATYESEFKKVKAKWEKVRPGIYARIDQTKAARYAGISGKGELEFEDFALALREEMRERFKKDRSNFAWHNKHSAEKADKNRSKPTKTKKSGGPSISKHTAKCIDNEPQRDTGVTSELRTPEQEEQAGKNFAAKMAALAKKGGKND